VAALVLVVASPLIVGGLALVGQSWFPMGDWASMAWRTSQVGTADTPLVGAYTVKGWAHPGPLLFWLAAPLWHLSGGDPRSLEWTAGLINFAMIVALAAVAWRRGRWALTLAVMLLTAVLIHAFTPAVMVDLWNPYVPLLAFLLTVVLVWDAALGRRRALVEAAVPACFAIASPTWRSCRSWRCWPRGCGRGPAGGRGCCPSPRPPPPSCRGHRGPAGGEPWAGRSWPWPCSASAR
jgi:hypothetical protein